jgi:hypothetical protein
MRKIALIFVAFSENLNFDKNNEIIQEINPFSIGMYFDDCMK